MAVGLIEALFLVAPVAVVPLAVGLVQDRDEPAPLRTLRLCLHPVAAVAAVGSFGFPAGPLAAAFAAVWLAFTVFLAFLGRRRLRTKGFRPANLAIAGGLAYVPIGGGWLVLSRLGAQPMGFLEPIVLLTAVHFHYAAFAAPILIGLAAPFVDRTSLQKAYPVLVAAALGGPPLVAAGITFSPLLGLFGAGVQSLAVVGLSVLLFVAVLPRVRSPAARVLLVVSAASPWLTASLALFYSWGQYSELPTISLPDMARIHGVLNALGFVLCGLLGLFLHRRRVTSAGGSGKEG